jgi:hypothetical protein
MIDYNCKIDNLNHQNKYRIKVEILNKIYKKKRKSLNKNKIKFNLITILF